REAAPEQRVDVRLPGERLRREPRLTGPGRPHRPVLRGREVARGLEDCAVVAPGVQRETTEDALAARAEQPGPVPLRVGAAERPRSSRGCSGAAASTAAAGRPPVATRGTLLPARSTPRTRKE